jgi:hypothetical protein
MARTFGALLFYDAMHLASTASAGSVTLTRNAADQDVSLNLANSTTASIIVGVADAKRPYITFPAFPGQGTVPTSNEFQELFGTAAGGPGNPMGASAATQFGTAGFPWGLAILDVTVIYSVTGASLTSGTIACVRNTYTNNAAFTTANIIASTAITLPVTSAANAPYVLKTSVAQPIVYEATDNSDALVILDLATAGGGTARVYGIAIHCGIEYS